MRLVTLVAVLGVAGCDQVWGLTTLAPQTVCDKPTCRTVTLPVFADTFLDSLSPDTVFGSRAALIGDSPADDVGLFKFDISGSRGDNMIAHDECFAHATLTLVPVGTAVVCSPTLSACTPCTNVYASADLYWATNQWSQDFATYHARTATGMWETPGAAGASDRSDRVTTTPSAAAGPLVISASADEIFAVPPDRYLAPDRLSVEVRIFGGHAVFATSDQNNCEPTASPPPSLELVLCR